MPPPSPLTAALIDPATGITIPFNADVDAYGVMWRMTSIDGWDSPDHDDAATPRSGSDGMWDSPSWYGGRTISIKGVYSAPDADARQAAHYRLMQACARDHQSTLLMNETVPKTSSVRRSGRLMSRPLSDTMGEFDLSVLAVDPRKYGTAQVSGTVSAGSGTGGLAPPWTPPVTPPAVTTGPTIATLTNTGIYETPPVITLYGPGLNLRINNLTTNQVLEFDIPLTVNDSLVVDVGAGTALLNGTAPRAPAPGSAVISTFMAEPGDNTYTLSGVLTDVTPPSAAISFYSAWI
jgi:hypothetical protein